MLYPRDASKCCMLNCTEMIEIGVLDVINQIWALSSTHIKEAFSIMPGDMDEYCHTLMMCSDTSRQGRCASSMTYFTRSTHDLIIVKEVPVDVKLPPICPTVDFCEWQIDCYYWLYWSSNLEGEFWAAIAEQVLLFKRINSHPYCHYYVSKLSRW